jgi:hypothetical protein
MKYSGIFGTVMEMYSKFIRKTAGDRDKGILERVRRDILARMKNSTVTNESGMSFPFRNVTVRLLPYSDAMMDSFHSAFLRNDSLREEILKILHDDKVGYPADLKVEVELERCSEPGNPCREANPLFELDMVAAKKKEKREPPEVMLSISRGIAEHQVYRIKKERILIGLSREVMDREGRVIRENDVAFIDDPLDEINSTVSFTHARIWFDSESGKFLIMDEASRYGTWIERDGRTLQVTAGDASEIRLKSGDDIFCGRTRIRFEQ